MNDNVPIVNPSQYVIMNPAQPQDNIPIINFDAPIVAPMQAPLELNRPIHRQFDPERESRQPSILRDYKILQNQIMDSHEYSRIFPSELKFSRQTSETGGFATNLFNILNWTDGDALKMLNVGCGWITDDEFFLIKNRFTIVTNIKNNTLNFKIRQCRFLHSKKMHEQFSFWKSELFTRYSTPDDLDAIDKRRSTDEVLSIDDEQLPAMMMVILDSVHLFCIDKSEIPGIKSKVINLWQNIIDQSGVFAVHKTFFINCLVKYLISNFRFTQQPNNEEIPDGTTLDFGQYVQVHNLDFKKTVTQMINYVLQHELPNTVTIKDFFSFYAHFGPENDILEKIHKLLCCSQDFGGWFSPGIQKFDYTKTVSGSYSITSANCFVLKRARKWTTHIYNLMNASSLTGYLIDEAEKRFLTWHAVLEHMNSQIEAPAHVQEVPVEM